MKNVWTWIKLNPNRTMFLIPIILVAGISISHVVGWYDIANPISWAVYLSIAIEVAAMTALVAAMNKIRGGVWFMFGLVTFIQMVGNIFFTFKEIDSNSYLFKSWIELTGPVWELVSDTNDITAMKRWLAFLEGGLLPIISLTSLHFFIKYDDGKVSKIDSEKTTETEKLPSTKSIFQNQNDAQIEKVVEYQHLDNNQINPISGSEDTKKSEVSSESNRDIRNKVTDYDTENIDIKSQIENEKIEEQIKNDDLNSLENYNNELFYENEKVFSQTNFEKESILETNPDSKQIINDEVVELNSESIQTSQTESKILNISQLHQEEKILTHEEVIEPIQNESEKLNNASELKDNLENSQKYEVEQFELTSDSEIVEIPIDGDFNSSNTLGKKLSYKRGS